MPVYDEDSSIRNQEQNPNDVASVTNDEELSELQALPTTLNEFKFTNTGSDKNIFSRTRQKISGLSTQSKVAVGVGGSTIVIIFIVLGSLFNFLGIFQLDHVLNNIDVRTWSRYNSHYRFRNDKFFRTYMKLRYLDKGDKIKNFDPDKDNLYFARANRVDTDNPIRDWYRTLRTSNFEEDLFKRNGIRFTAAFDERGKPRGLAVLTLDKKRNLPVNIEKIDFDKVTAKQFDKIANQIDNYSAEIFKNDWEARSVIRKAVDDNTRTWQVLKRRHIRRDIYNTTGISEWKIFEKTRSKTVKKTDGVVNEMYQKIYAKTSGLNNNVRKLIYCLFGSPSCPSTLDFSAPENKVSGSGARQGILDPEQSQQVKEPDGTTKSITSSGDEIAKAAEEALISTSTKEVDEAPKKIFVSEFTKALTKKLGKGPFVVWIIAKWLTEIDELFENRDGLSKLVLLVKNARMAQSVGVYATFAITKDQIHSGELNNKQLSAFFSTTKNLGYSEGWQQLRKLNSPDFVSAASETETKQISKEEYCKEDHKKQYGEFAWYCDQQRINGNSTAKDLTNVYNSSIGYFIKPIADAVRAIKGIPLVGWLIDTLDWLSEKIFGPIIEWFLKIMGLDTAIENAMPFVMTKLLEFLGVSDMYDGSEPGAANYLIAGSAANAEASARASGGMLQTKKSALESNKLVQAYTAQKMEDRSVFERYLALNNQESLVSKTIFDITNSNPSFALTKLGSLISIIPATISKIFSVNNVFASNSDFDATALTNWVGVDKYDIPNQCTDLDPLDQQYKEKGVFTNGLSIDMSWSTLRDTDAFWEAIYGALTPEQKLNPDPITSKIWNCHLLDARVQGGIGYVYGYEGDFGFDPNSDNSEPSSSNEPSADCGTTQDIAKELLSAPANKYITFNTPDAQNIMKLASDGKQVPVAATGKQVDLSPVILCAVKALADAKIKTDIGYITNGTHASTSLHYSGLAVDIGNEDNAKNIFSFLYDNAKKLKIDELIFNNPPSGTKNLSGGNPYSYGSDTLSAHADHIHLGVLE